MRLRERQSDPRSPAWRSLAAPFFAACLLLTGCDQEDVTNDYGGQTTTAERRSLNGTTVLARMFQQAGHTVTVRRALTPNLSETADVIVWFPDDFAIPPRPVRRWCEQWLQSRPGRTLIYVGRDYDAAPDYWRSIRSTAPADAVADLDGRLEREEARVAAERANRPSTDRCGWFGLDSTQPARTVRSLRGPWSDGIDPQKVEITLQTRFSPPAEAEVLLASNTDVIASSEWYNDGELIVITNGSFLLNERLVNHEHRKLAGRLLEHLPPEQRVVFLESGAGGPPIKEEEPSPKPPSGLESFAVWPINGVLFHLALVGIVFCFARFPLFGPARKVVRERTADFGQHIAALGQLLAAAGDRAQAWAKIRQYHQQVRPDSSLTLPAEHIPE